MKVLVQLFYLCQLIRTAQIPSINSLIWYVIIIPGNFYFPCMTRRSRLHVKLGRNSSCKHVLNLPLALGFVNNFRTMLSYADSSATPESFTSFSFTAMQMLCSASRSSSSSNACTNKSLLIVSNFKWSVVLVKLVLFHWKNKILHNLYTQVSIKIM